MRKIKQQSAQLNIKYLEQKVPTQNQQLFLIQQSSNIEFRHGRIKYFNDTSVFKIKNQQFKDALVFLKQAEKLLEGQQSTNQFNNLAYSNCVIQNYACVYYKQFQLQKSQHYMNMLVQNLESFIEHCQKIPKRANILYLSTQSQKKNLKILIINRFVLLSYYFQCTTITTQLGKLQFAVVYIQKCADAIKKICENLMQIQICQYGIKNIKSDPDRRHGMDILTNLFQEDILNDIESKQFNLTVVIDMLKEMKAISQQQQIQKQPNVVDEMNILDRKTLSPTTLEEYSQKITGYNRQILNRNIKIQLALYMSLCYFTLATLNRLIAGQKYNQYKKQSPLYKNSKQIHLRSIFVYARNIKNWSKYLQFIVNSFNSNYGIDLINSNFPNNLQPDNDKQKEVSQIPVYSQKNDMIMSVQKQKSIDINQIKHIHSKVSYEQTQIKGQIKIFDNPILKASLTKQLNKVSPQRSPNYQIVESKKLDFNEVIGLGINLDLGIYRNIIRQQDKKQLEGKKLSSRHENHLTLRHSKQKKQGKLQMRLALGKNEKPNKNVQMHSQNQKFGIVKSPSSNNSHQHRLKQKNSSIQNKKLKSSKNIYSSTPILNSGRSKRSRIQGKKIKAEGQRKHKISSLKNIPQYEINNLKKQSNRNMIVDSNLNSSSNKIIKESKVKLRNTVGEPQNQKTYINEYDMQKQKIGKKIKSKTINHWSCSNNKLNLRLMTDTTNEKISRVGRKMEINKQYNFAQNQKYRYQQKQSRTNPILKYNSEKCKKFPIKPHSAEKNKESQLFFDFANRRLKKNFTQQNKHLQRKRDNKNYHDLITPSNKQNKYKTDFISSIDVSPMDNQDQKTNEYNIGHLGAMKKKNKQFQTQEYLLQSSYQQPSLNDQVQVSPKKKHHDSSDNELYNSKPSLTSRKVNTKDKNGEKKKMIKGLEEKKQRKKKQYKKQSKQIQGKQLQKKFKGRKSLGFNEANLAKKQKNKKVN